MGGKKTKISTGESVLRRRMVNYFSLGGDARIGLGDLKYNIGFEKHRGTNKFCNKCCYCWESVKKMLCLSTMKMNETLLKITKFDEAKEDETNIVTMPVQDGRETTGDNYFAGNPASVVFLNIRSFMGGVSNPWRNSMTRLGLDSKRVNSNTNFKDENFGDGLLEILTFPTMMNISLENIMGGNSRTIAQYSGPFKLAFQSDKVFLRLLLEKSDNLYQYRRRIL